MGSHKRGLLGCDSHKRASALVPHAARSGAGVSDEARRGRDPSPGSLPVPWRSLRGPADSALGSAQPPCRVPRARGGAAPPIPLHGQGTGRAEPLEPPALPPSQPRARANRRQRPGRTAAMAEEPWGAPGSASRSPLLGLGPSWAGWACSVPRSPHRTGLWAGTRPLPLPLSAQRGSGPLKRLTENQIKIPG